MQTQASTTAEPVPTTLDENARNRLDELLGDVENSGEFFKFQDGGSQEIIFDLATTPGMRTRAISTKEGDKEITRFCFAIYNPRLRKNQWLELSNKWVKRALEAIKEYKTLKLIIRRRGSTMLNTEYNFLPA